MQLATLREWLREWLRISLMLVSLRGEELADWRVRLLRCHPLWILRRGSARRIARAPSAQLHGLPERHAANGGDAPPAPPGFDQRIQYMEERVPHGRLSSAAT